jgi:hypothetical protein
MIFLIKKGKISQVKYHPILRMMQCASLTMSDNNLNKFQQFSESIEQLVTRYFQSAFLSCENLLPTFFECVGTVNFVVNI